MIFYPETPGSVLNLFLAVGSLFCFSLLWVAMGWCASNLPLKLVRPRQLQKKSAYDLNKPHPQGWIFSSLCYVGSVYLIGIAVSMLIDSLTKYDTMSLSKERRILTVHFLLAPDQSFNLDQIASIAVEQEQLPEKWLSVYGPKFGCRITIIKKDGQRIHSNAVAYWHSRLHPQNEKDILNRFPSESRSDLEGRLSEERQSFYKLQNFLNELEALGAPIQFSYSDGSGKSRSTESLINIPGSSESSFP